MDSEFEAVVIAVLKGTVMVRASRHSDCENCGACLGGKAVVIEAIDPIGLQVGQKVLVQMQKYSLTLGALIVYIMPLVIIGISILMGLIISNLFVLSIYLCLFCTGGLGILTAFWWLKHYDRYVQEHDVTKPVIICIIS